MGRILYAPTTRAIVESAIQEAQYRESKYVGTEHLLIGIVRLDDAEPAASLLRQWFDCNAIHDHLWVINYDSLNSQISWKEYREWYQWGSRNIDDNCLTTALSLAPEWKSEFGCRLDNAIDLLNCALDHPACPEVPTADWLTQFVKASGNVVSTHS